MPRLMPCPECGQREDPLVWQGYDPSSGDAYTCPRCASLWYSDELKRFYEENPRYWQDELPPEDNE